MILAGRSGFSVFRDAQRAGYDELVPQLPNAKGEDDLQALVGSGDTWSIPLGPSEGLPVTCEPDPRLNRRRAKVPPV